MDDSRTQDAGLAPAASVDEVFRPGGALARTLPSFEPREGQRAMAGAIARTFDEGGLLLAEAGTGTGKTLAYLAPAILSGHRVVVSTGTKNLQEQILEKDLPLLRDAMARPFTATVMKGRGNYLCLHRFDAAASSPAARTPKERIALALIEAWLPGTATGDRAEIDDLPEDLPLWNDLSATTENCLGGECPRLAECFVTRMRQRAAESDVVIVNHHLLCADAALRQHDFGAVIPEAPLLVIEPDPIKRLTVSLLPFRSRNALAAILTLPLPAPSGIWLSLPRRSVPSSIAVSPA